MNHIPLPPQLYVPVLLTLTTVCVAGLIALILADSEAWTSAQRALIGREIGRLRMSRMLERQGIAREMYLRFSTVAEMRQDIARCRNCINQQRCDQCLSNTANDDAYTYCPNTWTLSRLKRRIAAGSPAWTDRDEQQRREGM